jgi:hypothetical protein
VAKAWGDLLRRHIERTYSASSITPVLLAALR